MVFSLFFCWNIALGSVLPVHNTHTTHTTHTIAICVAQITQSPFVCSIRNMYNVDRLLHLQSVLVASASSLLLCICAVCTRERPSPPPFTQRAIRCLSFTYLHSTQSAQRLLRRLFTEWNERNKCIYSNRLEA